MFAKAAAAAGVECVLVFVQAIMQQIDEIKKERKTHKQKRTHKNLGKKSRIK
jgi:hypothetical protein